MVRMNLKELNIYRSNKNFISSLSRSAYVKIDGSVSNLDIQAINDMFDKGSIYLMTVEEANEYMTLKHEKEVETKEEENNEE